LNARFILKCA